MEGSAPGQHLVENDTERENVRQRIDRLPLCLLGGHVRDGSKNPTFPGPLLGRELAVDRAHSVLGFGEPEVEDFYPPVIALHHVVGFEVSVGDALLVSCSDRIREQNRDLEELRE